VEHPGPYGRRLELAKTPRLAPRFCKFELPDRVAVDVRDKLELTRGFNFQEWLEGKMLGRVVPELLYTIDEHVVVPRIRQPRDSVQNGHHRLRTLADRAAAADGEPRVAYGRPRLGKTRLALIAYLADLEQHPLADLSAPFDGRSEATIRRNRDQGRSVLCDDGVWPWAVASCGVLPARWWRDALYTYCFAEWRHCLLIGGR
jgi:hypothetical protein